jgi:uncharacterized protein
VKLLSQQPAKYQRRYLPIVSLLILWLSIETIAHLGAEILWFEEVGYLPMYLLRLATQGWLGFGIFAIATSYLWGNLSLAQRLKSPHPVAEKNLSQATNYSVRVDSELQRIPTVLKLRWLLPVTLSLSLSIGIILVHYLRVAIGRGDIDPNLPNLAPPSPVLLRLEEIGYLIPFAIGHTWIVAVMMVMTLVILLYPQLLLRSISIILSIAIAWVGSQQWMQVLPYFQATPFQHHDPVFDRDISDYVFGLPVAELVEFGLMGICLYGLISVILTYILSGGSLSQGKFLGFSRAQQRHLCGLGGVLMLGVGFSYWVSSYELLYSARGVSYGASYTDINIQLPVDRILSGLALAIAGYLVWRAIYYPRQLVKRQPILVILGLYLGLAIVTTTILPSIFQALVVQPNELARETPYIRRTIDMTRQAFGLANIESSTFNPQANLTPQKIQANDLTIRNIRLWDEQPLLATNRQLQQIRPYYRFPDADIDRYSLAAPASDVEGSGDSKIDRGANSLPPSAIQTQQQVLIAARELDYASVPKQAQTWVNEHLIYTHGYGFTLSPVNRVAPGGLPEYFVKDIGMNAQSHLNTSSDAVRANIPIGQPRIYYGENANTYIMTGTKVKELDYPSGNANVYNIYDGRGGIKLDSLWRRLLFAKYLDDWRMVLTPEFLPETKLLFRRNIDRRIRSIAPFLRFDRDPYLVATDARKNDRDPSYLYWIVDAYTTSDRYPYADIGQEGINYIRNSVKVVIDAYHGSVSFYIADPRDPIVTTWAKIFPTLFKPLSAMPANLRQHIRYPEDIFRIQAERLIAYHMTDPQVFYNQEDRWQVPTEVYGDKPKVVEPYYLITSLPTIPIPEFTLLLPYTPDRRSNLVAWLAARSDGENYGKLVLYNFPKQRLVFGPEQIEARINQDPTISAQISLWNRQGSRVLQGNLLIVPIDRSLLYVEPIYLEATQNQIPTLVRVVVAYENRIVMAETLPQALKDIFRWRSLASGESRTVTTSLSAESSLKTSTSRSN